MADTKRTNETLVTLFPDTGRATPQNVRDLIVSHGWEGVESTRLKRVVVVNNTLTVGSAQPLCTITFPASSSGTMSARVRGHIQAISTYSGQDRSSTRFDYSVIAVQKFLTPTYTINASFTGQTSNNISTDATSISISTIEPSVNVVSASRAVGLMFNVTKGNGTFTTVKIIGEVNMAYTDLGTDPSVV